MRVGRLSIVLALSLVTVVAPSTLADGVEGPNPILNGGFDAAVPGSHVMAGWAAHPLTDPMDARAEVVSVDGDHKVETKGEGGYLMSPTNLGFTAARPAYSLLFDDLTFEVTDTEGGAVDDAGMLVMVLGYWATEPVPDCFEDTTSVALKWDGVGTDEAAEGLTLDTLSAATAVSSGQVTCDLSSDGDFSEEEIANNLMMGGVKIHMGSQELLLDDFAITGATLFGTYT